MDRPIIYPGQIPLDTDLLNTNRNTMLAIAKVAAALFGATTFATGLAVTPDSPASMRVAVAPGDIYALSSLDTSAYGSLAADTAHQVVKQGINLDTTFLTLTAPGTAGQSVNYLIQAALSEADTGAVVLPYYNSSNPAAAYSGPNNSGSSQATKRVVTVALQAKAGAAAATGTQVTPTPDSGFIGLYVVTVANGQTTITAGNISAYPGAPVIPSAGLLVAGLQNSSFNSASAGGSADAIAANFSPAITTLSNGMTLYVRAANANATSTPTLQANGTTAKTIVKGAGSALSAGDIAGAGHWIAVQYDATLDKWVLLNPATGARPTRLGINRIINGSMSICQRNGNTAVTVPTSAAYTVDRWIVAPVGASVSAQMTGGPGAYALQLSGAAGVTACQVLQRIEAMNIADLAGKTVTLSATISSSTLTSIKAQHTIPSAQDNYATAATTDLAAVAITSVPTRYTWTFTLPVDATNGAAIQFSAGAFTSGTWTITDVQLEDGSVATALERESYGLTLAKCQRYFWQPVTAGALTQNAQQYGSVANANLYKSIQFPVAMRVTPTVVAAWSNGTNSTGSTISATSTAAAQAQLISSSPGEFAASIDWTSFNAEI